MAGPATEDPTEAAPDGAAEDRAALGGVLTETPPFDAMPAAVRDEIVRAARIERFGPGELILDAFVDVSVEVYVVTAGRVDLWWSDGARTGDAADERVGVGGVFGFSAMLSERSIGPRAVAVEPTTAAAIPAAAVEPVFASRQGVGFLAALGALALGGRVALSSYSLVDELIEADPLVVEPDDPVADVAAAMTRRDVGFAVVPLEDGEFGLVTDALLRRRVLVEGRAASITSLAGTPSTWW